jgi:hypothetical protein
LWSAAARAANVLLQRSSVDSKPLVKERLFLSVGQPGIDPFSLVRRTSPLPHHRPEPAEFLGFPLGLAGQPHIPYHTTTSNTRRANRRRCHKGRSFRRVCRWAITGPAGGPLQRMPRQYVTGEFLGRRFSPIKTAGDQHLASLPACPSRSSSQS